MPKGLLLPISPSRPLLCRPPALDVLLCDGALALDGLMCWMAWMPCMPSRPAACHDACMMCKPDTKIRHEFAWSLEQGERNTNT
jgi:hypothetical protein